MVPQQTTTTAPPSTPAPRCLLCNTGDCRPVATLTCAELLGLWTELGVSFSAGALAMIESRSVVELQECRGCGFRFFDPALAGQGVFYADLQRHSGGYTCPSARNSNGRSTWPVVKGCA